MAKSASTLKKERFKNVASRRVQKVIDDLESLAKCANRVAYDYSEDDVRKMMRVLRERFKLLELSFNNNAKTSRKSFEF